LILNRNGHEIELVENGKEAAGLGKNMGVYTTFAS